MTVIIIIGILVTMAVPQYQKLVNRARWTECIWLAGAVRTGQILHYTEYRVYCNGNITDLNTINLPPLNGRLFAFSIKTPNFIYGVYEGYDDIPADDFTVVSKPYFYVNLTANLTGWGGGAPYQME